MEDFAFFEDKCFAILIFGSYARGEEEYYSDIDVCIVLKDQRNYSRILYEDIYPDVRMDIYDVVIFEGCSENIKSDISKNHIPVYCRNLKELENYLKPYLEYKPAEKNREEMPYEKISRKTDFIIKKTHLFTGK